MRTKTKTLTALAVAAALGGTVLAGASYAGHRDGGHGMAFLDNRGSSRSRRWRCSRPSIPTATASSRKPRSTSCATTSTRRTTPTATATSASRSSPDSGTRPRAPLTVRTFQMLDTDGDAVVTRAEYDRPLAGIVERLDRDGDGGLSMKDRWHDDDDERSVGRRLGLPPVASRPSARSQSGHSRDAAPPPAPAWTGKSAGTQPDT